MSPDTVSIRIGAQITVVARARTSAGVEIGNATMNWASNDTAVAAVNQTGSVSAKRFGPAIITATTAGVSGVVHVQVLAALRDSTIISSTDTTRVVTGQGSTVTVAPNAGLSGQRLIVEETAPPAGTTNPLGPAIKVSLAGSLAGVRANASAALSDLSFTVSTVTAVPAGTVAPGESRIAFLLSGGLTLATPSTPLLRVSDFEAPSISGTGASTLTSSSRLTMAGSTPLMIVPTSAPPPCSQTDFPDGERLYRIRTAPASVGPAPFALVLVHGWQPTQLKPPFWNCEAAAAWRPAEDTWSTFLSRFYPADGSPGENKRLQLFDVWIAHYPSHGSIQSNGDALARLLAQQIPSKRIVVLAHSMGGLVTAAALRTTPSLAIDTIVALGTPWRGTPFPGGSWILSSGWGCATIAGSAAGGFAAATASLTEGSRGLSDATNGYLQTTLRSKINELAPRVTAVAGNIRSAHVNPSLDIQYLFYAFGDCVLKDLGYNSSDGVVPSTSVSAEGQIRDVTIINGLDHSQLYAVVSQVDPLRIAADRFLAYLDHHVPVATVAVAPAIASITMGSTQQFTTVLKDATGAILTGRTVTWSSGSASVTVNNATGLATGVAVGTATITASCEGKSATATVTVTQGGPIVLQPGPTTGSDIWITSTFSYGSNYGVDDEQLQVGGWGDWYYSLLKFDVSSLPPNAVSATIELQPFRRADQSTPVQMSLYRVTSTWNTNTGWFSQPSATFERTLAAPVIGSTYLIDVTSLYNGWKSGATPNFGVELRPTGNANEFNVFRSSNYLADPLLRPKLVIKLTLDQPAAVASVTVTPASATIAVGANQQFAATLKDASGSVLAGRSVAWSTSNASVASVISSTGFATGVAAGTATITATSEGKSGTATITVASGSAGQGVTTDAADGVTSFSARLHGTVARSGGAYTVWFEWGLSPTLTTYSLSGIGSGPSASCPGTAACSWSYDVATLNGNTAYYFRLVVSDAAGTTRGAIRSFTTAPQPPLGFYAVGAADETSPSSLYRVTPTAAGTDQNLGLVRTVSGETLTLTDIAQAADGALFAISYSDLYRLTLTPPTVTATRVGALGVAGRGANALAFSPSGGLFAAGVYGDVWSINTSLGAATSVGAFGLNRGSAGDLAFVSLDEVLAVDGGYENSAPNRLVRVRPSAGWQATDVKAGATLGIPNVWGLRLEGSTLYGLTAPNLSSTGQLVEIDQQLGTARVIRALNFLAFGAGAVRAP